MKKIILIGTIVLMNLLIYGQQNSANTAISYLPKDASGYLILDAVKYPTVTNWNVYIQQKSTNAMGTVSYSTVNTVNLSNTYFTKIASQFANGNYYLSIQGKNSSGTIVVTEGPLSICPGCPGDGQSCKVYCIAPTYAWQGFYSANSNGGNIKLKILSTNLPNGDPAYQYFTSSQFGQLPGGSVPPQYYNCSAYNLSQGDKIITVTIPSSTSVQDASGTPINGNLYAIKKYLGPWAGQGVIEATNIAGDFQTLCGQGASTAVSIINTNSNSNGLTPALSCSGVSGGSSLPSLAGSFSIDCFSQQLNELEQGTDPWVVFENFINCHDVPGAGFDWPSNVAVINLMPFNNPNGTVISIRESDFYDSNGNFVAPSITLGVGLYIEGIQFTDNSYASVFFESKLNKTYTYSLANLLSASVAPVPIINNEFDLRLKAFEKIKFDYYLYDLNANMVYTKHYDLQKGASIQDHINITQGIPSGQLINKFIFEDGSELVFQTVK